MTPAKVKKIFERFAEHNPSPTTELKFNNPFQLLIAVMLSAQATDTSVNKATEHLFKKAGTAQAILDLGLEQLKQYIKTIGLFNTKAKNVIKTCEILVQDYQGDIPRSREALETLPGVGRKTANVILNTAFGENTIAVDTHVFRVSKRLGLAKGNTPLAVENELQKIVPTQYKYNAHHWLILHGRYICVARKPKCPQCFQKDLCEYPHKTLAGEN